MKKTLTIILLLLCAAISVQAQVSYGISVCGKEVTSDNSGNVLGDGKVSYKNGTLMLMAGADLTVSGPNYGIEVEERYERSDLNIYLMGDAKIQSYADCIHLSKDVKVTFMGSKTLTLNSTAANGIYAEGEGDILFTMGITVNCIVKNVGFYHNPKEKGLLRFAEMKTSTIYGEGGAVIGFEDVAFMANYLKDDYYTYDKVNRVMLDNRKQTAQRVNVAYGYGVTINGIDLTPENVGTLSKVFSYEEGDGLSTSPQLTIHDTATLIALSEAPLIELHRNCDEFIIHIDGDVKIDGKDISSYFILSKGECSLQIAGTRNNTLTVTGFKNGIQHCYDDAMLNMNNQKPFDSRLCIRKLFMNMDLAGKGDGITTAAYIYFDTCNLNITKCKHHAIWAKSYAYDEAEIILPARAMINGGCVMEADFHTPAKNVSISSEESYGVVIGETPITYKNYNDVFGDGTVRYDYHTHTLYLNNANIDGVSSRDKIDICCSGTNKITTFHVGFYNSKATPKDEYATNILFASESASLNIHSYSSEGVIVQGGGLYVGPGGYLEVSGRLDAVVGGAGLNNRVLIDGANAKIKFSDMDDRPWRSWFSHFDEVIFQNCHLVQPQGVYYDTDRKIMLNSEGYTENSDMLISNSPVMPVYEFDITGGEVVYNGAPNYDWSYKFVAPYEGYNLEFFFNIPNQPAAGIKPELTFNLEDMDADKTYLRNTYNGATATFSSVSFTAYEGTDFTIYEAEMVLYDQSVGFKLHCVVYDDEDPLATGITAPSVSSLHTGRAWGGSPAYNLNGQRVSDSYKGMVIKNGRKYTPSK